MDVENLLKELRRAERYCLNDYSRMAGEAATALSTLQAENSQLRDSRDHWKRLAHELSEGVNGKDERLQSENAQLRAELEQVKMERDMAVEDFRRIGSEGLCSVCENLNAPDLYCADCKGTAHIVTDMFEWRGQKEN